MLFAKYVLSVDLLFSTVDPPASSTPSQIAKHDGPLELPFLAQLPDLAGLPELPSFDEFKLPPDSTVFSPHSHDKRRRSSHHYHKSSSSSSSHHNHHNSHHSSSHHSSSRNEDENHKSKKPRQDEHDEKDTPKYKLGKYITKLAQEQVSTYVACERMSLFLLAVVLVLNSFLLFMPVCLELRQQIYH